ncbi:zinc ABC transporter substrate-binding protein [Sporosarcina ureilytica]|uniref:Zinc ABC transporter substrate-binding protein n=2 Tax=Sporosarcina ureilytica TaxID=298596 RepID=A0A1D8JKQ6_9BACL|nr:zinc ABC transporter substrate-binding protein [Sporosarcina ureilytica]
MKKLFKAGIVTILATFLLVACGNQNEKTESGSDKIQAIATFSIIHDIVSEIGGEHVDVHSMVPIGTDPHEYEPLPVDIKKATDADALFYNGLNLEGEEHGWFFKLVDSVGADKNKVFELMEGVEPLYLTSDDGSEKEVNPHAFLDPIVVIQMTENARDALIEVDPENKAHYEKKAEQLLEKLRALDEEYKTKIAEIPDERRVLVTSERAYQYMAERYGLKEGYIWEVDTEENGSPAQIKSLVSFVKENNVPALFVETNVDPRPMETVSNETGVPIAAKLFSDELGRQGADGSTVISFLQYNIDTIYEHLKE